MAVFVEAATAIHATGSGTVAGVSYSAAVSGAEGRGGVTGQVAAAAPAERTAAAAPAAAAAAAAAAPVAATTPSSGTSATTWILIGVVAAALAVGLTWTLVRRRRRLASDTRQYCSLHPEDALCGAA